MINDFESLSSGGNSDWLSLKLTLNLDMNLLSLLTKFLTTLFVELQKVLLTILVAHRTLKKTN